MPSYQSASNAQFTAPAAADSVSLTPSGVAWTNSAYVTLLASISSDAVLTAVHVRTTYNANVDFEVDIATGAAASEVVIATIKGWSRGQAFSTGTDFTHFTLTIPVDAIANGARLSARIRHSTTDVTAWLVAVSYYKKPIVGLLDVSAKPPKVAPAAAALTSMTGNATAWLNGTYVQVIASTAAALVVDGIIATCTSNGVEFEIDIGVGAAASEVVVHTIRGIGAVLTGGFGYVPLSNPLDNIGSGKRVAVRARAGTAGGATCLFGMSYREKPL